MKDTEKFVNEVVNGNDEKAKIHLREILQRKVINKIRNTETED